ncbi:MULTISPECIES: single-stranded DNA-binding protein [Vibrio]|nr:MULTISPECIES: single-stranded DNA-binding protein [Vibrio]PMI57975.1 fumarate reductase [Vibrio lentus]CAK1876061.1 Single-stranded DNA-binding protein [Vibrio crassostreae]CAK1876572.1 Single-stranded DNA-binding protein [Vibrio crassostreae]CAK1888971.1 Single-stranded DNA-binding protein [Vibrio crassostreae]CAK1889460.1 Single-stranded DNA-binding protein [Vibrio crassostreae]
MIKIEIFKEDERVEQRTSRAKDDKPSRTFYEQDAYAYLVGKFPSLIKISMEKDQTPYAAGLYTLHSSSYAINNFGALELKRFGQLITPIEA